MEKLEARDRAANQRNEDAVGDVESKYRGHARYAAIKNNLLFVLRQDIRRHLMTKRPHVMKDPEDGLKSTEEAHKPSHHHPSKNHVNRHHKKHEHGNTINPGVTTVRSTTVKHVDRTTDERVASTIDTTENKSRFNVTAAESSDTDTQITTSEPTSTASLSSTFKPKKASRRQKAKEPVAVGNRTETEDDKVQRRRKIHHHRRNNTLFTNSVHDEVPSIVNASETIETTVTAQTTTSRSHHQTRYTTIPTMTTMKETTIHRETVTGLGDVTNDFTKENTVGGTNPQTMLSTGSETPDRETTESQTTTPPFARTTTGIEGPRSRTTFPSTAVTTTTTSVTVPVTISSNKRFPKIQKNRTNNLGPSRIDVTILESPDRRSRQGERSSI